MPAEGLEPDARLNAKRIEIRWRDMDANGHVNNAVYLTYFEEGRDDWLQRVLGVELSKDYVLGRISVTFKRPIAQTDDAVLVRCQPVKIGNSTVHTLEELLDQAGSVCAVAEAVVVALDPKSGKARELSRDERANLERELMGGTG
jgi:acyl-CoA thioester hydrolase